ncbi:hypothetical protein AB8A05_29615 [Tardiphaga sp. 538_B7_N1_4]|uniref:hypothetical protein n=1 Tax=Tardiphaga sp. 538_B7_N1_4 TaxID=3240778 RepID=UPI003F274DE8
MTLYEVFIDDNFHYQNKSERAPHAAFETMEQAVAACKRIVDDFLIAAFEPGMRPADLYEQYISFGDDPFVVAGDPRDLAVVFSAWDYARARCEMICAF